VGGTLRIREKDHGFIKVNMASSTLCVTVPEDYEFDELKISAGAGNIDIERLCADKLDLDLGAGNVEIDEIKVARSADIDGGAGNMNISSGSIRNLDLDMGDGEITVCCDLCSNNDIDCGIGEMNLALCGDKDDYRVKIEKGVGAVSFDGEKLGSGSYGNGANRIEISGGIGEINVEFRKPEVLFGF